jgi:hypothetical protein
VATTTKNVCKQLAFSLFMTFGQPPLGDSCSDLRPLIHPPPDALRHSRRRKYYTLQVQPIAASRLLSNEFRFDNLFAPVGSELAMALKVEHENRTRLSQSGCRSPSARHRTSSDRGLCEGCSNASGGEGRRDVVGTIVSATKCSFLQKNQVPTRIY